MYFIYIYIHVLFFFWAIFLFYYYYYILLLHSWCTSNYILHLSVSHLKWYTPFHIMFLFARYWSLLRFIFNTIISTYLYAYIKPLCRDLFGWVSEKKRNLCMAFSRFFLRFHDYVNVLTNRAIELYQLFQQPYFRKQPANPVWMWCISIVCLVHIYIYYAWFQIPNNIRRPYFDSNSCVLQFTWSNWFISWLRNTSLIKLHFSASNKNTDILSFSFQFSNYYTIWDIH